MSPPRQAWSSQAPFSSGRSLASMTDVEAFILALEDPVSKFFVNSRVSNQEDMTMWKRLTPGIVAPVFATLLIFGAPLIAITTATRSSPLTTRGDGGIVEFSST